MGTIAKGEITLSPVNDAYTVLLTPASCVINADFDGSNPKLGNAKGSIMVKRGTKEVPFHIIATSYPVGLSLRYTSGTLTNALFNIADISDPSLLNGTISFNIVTDDGFGYNTTVRFSFTIVRESTMLDWIKDWEGTKTKVGGTYIMTPKLFVGNKENIVQSIEHETPDSYEVAYEWIEDAITGIYLGPDLLGDKQTVGLYGYYLSKEIFHLNADGGMIGGWDINEAGISSGNLKILSEGAIIASSSIRPFWALYADGHAIFANGKVKFQADGSAEFAGKITSTSGTIGGWSISKNQLHNQRLIIDSQNGYIGINADELKIVDVTTGDWQFPDNPQGGVKLWYTSANDFGMAAWATSQKVFQLGSTNFIAGWSFNHQAIWTGSVAPYLSQNSFAANAGELTIAPNGIRSNKWYVDADGTAQFVGGNVRFDAENAEMFGWKMRVGRLSASHAALVSNSYYCGVFVSPGDLSEVDAYSLTQTIGANGGIYIYSDGANSVMRAFDTKGNLGFYLSTAGYNTIGNWNFNHQAIYIGSELPDSATGFAPQANYMILSASIGLIGHKWRLSADGSGAIAGGHISWNANGDISLDNSVKISWSNVTDTDAITNKLTKIDANGIYTGTISADKITVGNISTDWVKNGDKWGLMVDGSGYLASKNVTWDKDGNVFVKGEIEATSGQIAGFKISGNSLTNVGFDNDACIIFRNDTYDVFGAMGGNTFPISSGLRAVARFENNDSAGLWFSRNIALYLSAQNGKYNHAFIGHGNGTLNGWIGGYRFDRFVLTTANTIYTDYVNLNKNNKWLCKSTASNAGIALPRLDAVQDALGIGNSTPFCIDLMIMSDIGTNNYFIYGRTDRKDSNNQQPWNSDQYPVFVHWDGGRWERQELGTGDCFHVLLIYDPSETQTLDGFSCKYTARVISKQA